MGALKLIHSITPYFYERFVPAGYQDRDHPVRKPDRRQVRGRHQVGRFRHVRHRRRDPRRRRARAGRGVRFRLQQGHGGGGRARTARIDTLKDLKGKRVAIWPGSTQEVFILERLHMEGMTIKDIQPVRVSFSEMPAALARGDVDAYVGAEPGPGLSLVSGVGKIVEYPYSTPMGSLNMILGDASRHARARSRSWRG